MEEVGKALKAIFDKLSDFFNIFDLSFFVSGFLTACAICFWSSFREIDVPSSYLSNPRTAVIILLCYVCGLFSFMIGRGFRAGIVDAIIDWHRVRKGKEKKFDNNFREILVAHGLDADEVANEYIKKKEFKRLYIKYWAEVRSKEKYSKSLTLLNRYWVMAATYDGLTMSTIVSLVLLIESTIGVVADRILTINEFSISAFAILVIFGYCCIREAHRFAKYQMEEIVATIVSGI